MFTNTLRRPRFALAVLLVWALCAAPSGAQVKPDSLGTQEPEKAPEARQKEPFTQFTSREQWQMPIRVMGEIGVRPGMTVADVGAGDGWFTFYLAERVGSSGRVIAEEIDAEVLQAVRERRARGHVSNVSVLVGEVEDPKLPAGTVDLALMVNVLSALEHAKSFLGHLAKGLKPDGRLVGVVISVSMALVYVTYNAISISFVYSHFLEDMVLAECDRASAGMDTTQAARLLDSLRAEATLRTLVIGNFTSVSRIGTFWSVLIAVAFLQRWRRARTSVVP